ncbi:MAG: sigma-70 family RNA polymerase sigma factor [Verrucomicrobiales bacterium]|nr:sigma-70 family RNA polymerase sigma factor [Verrucomicrobiales bacterium]
MEIYGPLIPRFALSRGSHRDAAPDIIQEVLRSVARAMQGSEYDPSKGTFRDWLFTAIRREIGRVAKKAKRSPASANTINPNLLLDQLPDEREAQDWDVDYKRHLVHWAIKRVGHEFGKNGWESFVATAIHGRTPEVIAKKLGVTTRAVYIAKSRVMKRFIEKVHSVDQEESES